MHRWLERRRSKAAAKWEEGRLPFQDQAQEDLFTRVTELCIEEVLHMRTMCRVDQREFVNNHNVVLWHRWGEKDKLLGEESGFGPVCAKNSRADIWDKWR